MDFRNSYNGSKRKGGGGGGGGGGGVRAVKKVADRAFESGEQQLPFEISRVRSWSSCHRDSCGFLGPPARTHLCSSGSWKRPARLWEIAFSRRRSTRGSRGMHHKGELATILATIFPCGLLRYFSHTREQTRPFFHVNLSMSIFRFRNWPSLLWGHFKVAREKLKNECMQKCCEMQFSIQNVV